uniref:hypothetical protein n=1 Tax=Gordonia sp. B7-2 TaxID=3420932 RepID=UPI003D92F973
MSARSRMRLFAALGVVVALGVAGCGAETTDDAASSTAAPTTPATSRTLETDQCLAEAPQGRIDRAAHDLAFRKGFMRVAVVGPDNTTCYEFARWGPAQPDVPPDSLLFVFKGAGTDGAQLEFLIGELTGGVLPNIGTVRPKVGPLTAPINAQVGVSAGGAYHHSAVCALTITAMSDDRAAGSFVCPTAALTDANPIAPDDAVPYDADESSSSAPPAPPPPAPGTTLPPTTSTTTPGPPATVSFSGWFDIRP